jgi:hypothetical protein
VLTIISVSFYIYKQKDTKFKHIKGIIAKTMTWESVSCHPTVKQSIITALTNGNYGEHADLWRDRSWARYRIASNRQHLQCQQIPDGFCGTCKVCQRIDNHSYPDVIFMHPWEDWSKKGEKSTRKKVEYTVDHMREVQRFAQGHPYEADSKSF